jgi:prephenate dehydratase
MHHRLPMCSVYIRGRVVFLASDCLLPYFLKIFLYSSTIIRHHCFGQNGLQSLSIQVILSHAQELQQSSMSFVVDMLSC